jgi:hypothetical protein
MFISEFALFPPPQVAHCVAMEEKENSPATQHILLKAQLHLLSNLAVRYSLPAECSESFNLVLKIKIMLFSPLKYLADCVSLKVRKNRVYKRMSCAFQNIEASIRNLPVLACGVTFPAILLLLRHRNI